MSAAPAGPGTDQNSGSSGSSRRVGAVAQVSALVGMRFSALSVAARRRVLGGLLLPPAAAVAAVAAGVWWLPEDGSGDALVLLPTAWLGFLVTVVVATGASGARTLLPRDQTVAFPLTAGADQLSALLLSPLNVAWLVETLGLLALAAWPTHGITRVALIALTVAWILTATVVAQAAGWLVELARTFPRGPWVIRGGVAAAALAGLALTLTGRLVPALDRAPTRDLVAATVAIGEDRYWPPLAVLTGLAVAAAVANAIGVALAGVLQRRAARDQVAAEAREYPARPDPGGELAAALRIDHAGVFRSAPLRRGLVVLTLIPALTCAVAGLDWSVAAILPGLVASGAGLLFGVNALSLDGPGALWRESLPGRPRAVLVARLLLITEICLVAAVLAAFLGAVRASGPPTGAAVVALLGAVVATTAQVVSRCAAWSVRRPYAAALRDARDQPAPPTAMAGYSVRLAVATTVTGMIFSVCARYGLTVSALALTVAVVAPAGVRTLRALREWEDDAVRSRVVATVAG